MDRSLDGSFGRERLDLCRRVPELLQYLVTVLAEQWSRRDLGRRRRKLDWVAGRDVTATHGVLDLDDHLARLQVGIGHHLTGIETRATRNARAGQNFHDVALRELRRPALDERVDLGLALPACLGGLVARVADQVGAADGLQERMPELLRTEEEHVVVRTAGMA